MTSAQQDEPPFVVALDLDEVLGQYLKAYSAFYNAAHGTDFTVTNFHSYKFWEVTGETKEECQKNVYDFHDSQFFRDLEVVPGAVDGVRKLVDIGVQLHVVTSRHAEIAEQTRQWLRQHFPGVFAEDRVHILNHWGCSKLQKAVSKPAMCESIGAKVLVDDSTVYIGEVRTIGISGLLFDLDDGYKWNKEPIETTSPLLTRVNSWPEVVSEVRGLLGAHRSQCEAGRPSGAVPWPESPAAQDQNAKPQRECAACQACTVS